MQGAYDDFLLRAKNMEDDPGRYAVNAITWLHELVQSSDRPAWAGSIDSHFKEALRIVAEYYRDEVAKPLHDAVQALQETLACWQAEPEHDRHPLVDLARLLEGNPGEFLEYRGPVLSMTTADVLQGISAAYILNEWDLSVTKQAETMFMLCVLAIAEIAIAVYWSSKAGGSNLGVELKRLFAPGMSASTFRGQMANLILAGHAASWGQSVGFISEGADKTPDWYVESSCVRLWVECTSFERTADTTNDEKLISSALGRAWHEKKVTFSPESSPGLVSSFAIHAAVRRHCCS